MLLGGSFAITVILLLYFDWFSLLVTLTVFTCLAIIIPLALFREPETQHALAHHAPPIREEEDVSHTTVQAGAMPHVQPLFVPVKRSDSMGSITPLLRHRTDSSLAMKTL